MFEVSVRTRFSAAHRLEGYPGTCASFHGHNWDVEVYLRGEELDETGILADFRRLKQEVADVLRELDHADLNRVAAFRSRNPTSENIARHLYVELAARLNNPRCRVYRVAVNETPDSRACYWDPAAGGGDGGEAPGGRAP